MEKRGNKEGDIGGGKKEEKGRRKTKERTAKARRRGRGKIRRRNARNEKSAKVNPYSSSLSLGPPRCYIPFHPRHPPLNPEKPVSSAHSTIAKVNTVPKLSEGTFCRRTPPKQKNFTDYSPVNIRAGETLQTEQKLNKKRKAEKFFIF